MCAHQEVHEKHRSLLLLGESSSSITTPRYGIFKKVTLIRGFGGRMMGYTPLQHIEVILIPAFHYFGWLAYEAFYFLSDEMYFENHELPSRCFSAERCVSMEYCVWICTQANYKRDRLGFTLLLSCVEYMLRYVILHSEADVALIVFLPLGIFTITPLPGTITPTFLLLHRNLSYL